MPFKRYARKQLKRAGRYAKKRYFKGKGYSTPKIGTMAKDLANLKKMINAEKQNVESVSTTEYNLAQYNGVSSNGGRVIDIMPIVSQGVSEDQRKGDSLKVCSWCLKLQVYNNGNLTLSGNNYKFYVLRQPTNPVPTTNTFAQFLETNPFSGVSDYYSSRNYEHFKDWVVMATCSGKLKANESGDANQGSKTNVHTVARKQEFHIRYDKGTTDIINNPIYLVALSSDGDRNTSNKIMFKFAMKVYYYDN